MNQSTSIDKNSTIDKSTIIEYIQTKLEGFEYSDGEHPIVVMGPDGSKSQNKLRVYAYGGFIGNIPMSINAGSSLLNPEYGKYLKEYWLYNNAMFHIENRKVYNDLSYLKTELAEVSATQYAECLISMCSDDSRHRVEHLFDEIYLKLAVTATLNKFKKMSEEDVDTDIKGEAIVDSEQVKRELGERKVQTNLIWQQRHEGKSGSIVITDMEYKFKTPLTGYMKRTKEKNLAIQISKKMAKIEPVKLTHRPKPDYVMFDGERFGLVELKYNGESMEADADNSLREHMLDFCNLIARPEDSVRGLKDWINVVEKYKIYNVKDDIECKSSIYLAQIEAIRDCAKRAIALCDYQVIDSKRWEASVKKILAKAEHYYRNSPEKLVELFWCGLLFVEGDDTNRREDYIRSQIKLQLDGFQTTDVDMKYQYITKEDYTSGNYVINMNQDLKQLI